MKQTLLLKGGRVIDPASGTDGLLDVRIEEGTIEGVGPSLAPSPRDEIIDVTGKLVIPGMIDTHAHVYQHVTGRFGLAPDIVGVRSGVTTIVDQGGPSCMTIGGFRHFIAEPAATRVLAYISAYLVGGLEGHLYPSLYGPDGVNVAHTVRVARENADIVRGIKAHAEIGGFSRWGMDVIRLARDIADQSGLPLYIHLGQLWPTLDNADVPGDEVVTELLGLMAPGDVLAHPFTRHPGGFVSDETGELHPLIGEALARGVRVDVGHGSHFSFEMARRVLDAGILPTTLGADLHGYNVSAPEAGASEEERQHNPFRGAAPFSLNVAMTELLALGVPLADIVAMVTSNAAELLGLQGEIGALAPGRRADITVLEPISGRFRLTDNSGGSATTEQFLAPIFCLRDGVLFEADAQILPRPELLAA